MTRTPEEVFARHAQSLGAEREHLGDVLVELRVQREHRDGRRGGGLGLGARPTVSYSLTPAGQALLPVLRGLTTWAEDNLPA